METEVRKLGVADATLLVALRREALTNAPFAFASSPEDDPGSQIESVRVSLGTAETHAVFGAWQAAALVGMVGLRRETRVKQRHKATIWGMYVTPSARRTGVARGLLNAAIEHARAWSVEQLQLSASEVAPEAQRLYESAGFRVWGTEPRALRWEGRFVAEHHLALDLS